MCSTYTSHNPPCPPTGGQPAIGTTSVPSTTGSIMPSYPTVCPTCQRCPTCGNGGYGAYWSIHPPFTVTWAGTTSTSGGSTNPPPCTHIQTYN